MKIWSGWPIALRQSLSPEKLSGIPQCPVKTGAKLHHWLKKDEAPTWQAPETMVFLTQINNCARTR